MARPVLDAEVMWFSRVLGPCQDEQQGAKGMQLQLQ